MASRFRRVVDKVTSLLNGEQTAHLERGIVARFEALNQRLDAGEATSHLERGIVARFEALNKRLDEDAAFLGSLRSEINRLDGYMVYHFGELSREVAKLIREDIVYTSPNTDAVLINGDYDIVLPSAEVGLITYLVRHGPHTIEPGVTAAIRSHLKEGSVAVDVGANVGLHTLTMAECVGSGGMVHAIEPNSSIAEALRRTLRLNGFEARSSLTCAAAAERAGSTMFYRTAHSPESSLFPVQGAEAREVETFRLDDLIPASTPVDLVKIDAEGAEPLVYQGMTRIIGESPTLHIIMEWSASHFGRTGLSSEAFHKQLSSDGFVGFVIDEERPGELHKWTGAPDSLEGANVLFVRK
ncbi:FkbM family methyltransferase [Mesorhizobium sp. 1B3]|uniref:FkbM family methyltransferase n=1 Tax=Mesorhizobium sp. 1B3 TaxID=3243599 RepID=UPI003D98554B